MAPINLAWGTISALCQEAGLTGKEMIACIREATGKGSRGDLVEEDVEKVRQALSVRQANHGEPVQGEVGR